MQAECHTQTIVLMIISHHIVNEILIKILIKIR